MLNRVNISIESYRQFVTNTLACEKYFNQIKDARKKPQILASTIAKSVFYGLSMGIESLLEIDNFVKTHDLAKSLGLNKTESSKPLLSDSTITRSLTTMKIDGVRKLMAHVAQKLIDEFNEAGMINKFRTAAIDKSTIAGIPVVVCRLVGHVPQINLDFEAFQEGDNEVEAAKRLFDRVREDWGWLIDTYVVDGLYTQWFINRVLKSQRRGKTVNVIVKSREKDLNLTKQVEELVQVNKNFSVEPGKFTDEDVAKEVRFMEFYVDDQALDRKIRVIKVWEQEIKGKKLKDEYYLITTLTKDDAAAKLVCKIGRCRWGIENNCFRQTSQNMNGKHQFCKDNNASQAMVTFILLAEECFTAFVHYSDRVNQTKRTKKLTIRFLMRTVRESVPTVDFKLQQPQEESKQLLLFPVRLLASQAM